MQSQKSGFLRSLLSKWQSQATLMGKAVLPVLLVVRLVTLGVAGQTVWLDDFKEFVCNTRREGCSEVCFNRATPVSPIRLWTLQLVLVLASGLVFLCYLVHLTNQENQVKQGGEVKGHTMGAYLACMASVILLEVGFVVAQLFLYGFQVMPNLDCARMPCPYVTHCVAPRAQQKTAFLLIMFSVSCLSLLLSVAEAACVLQRARPWERQQAGAKSLQPGSKVEERRHFLSQLLARWHSPASLRGKTVLPVLQLTRLVIVGAVVRPVWQDELSEFVCDSREPGCKHAVHNQNFPFSLPLYWSLQEKLASGVKGHSLRAYLACLSAVILVDVGFAAGQCVNYGLSVPTHVHGNARPCPSQVSCVVSRATEKTVFTLLMFSLACVSALLSLVEMCVVLKRERPWDRRQDNAMTDTSGPQMGSKVNEEDDRTDTAKLNI
uniref:uncharacterized protein n=1 Tax=Centroberyx gerrardi TaxID=166262 RepID=UPI003AAAE5B4